MVSYVAHTSNGIFYEDRKVFVDKRLPGMEYAQAGIILEPGAEFLVSYDTIAAEKTADGWIHIYGLFSATTRKHIGRWGKRIGVSYGLLKSLYEDNKEYNVYTGEYRDATNAPVRTVGGKL